MSTKLTAAQVKELQEAHRVVKDKRIADWIKSVILLDKGYSYSQIKEILLLDESTVRRARKRYEDRGVYGLLETKYIGGNNKKLTSIEEEQLKVFLVKNTQQTTIAIQEHIKTVYRAGYSQPGVTSLLHRLGFSYKKPKVIPGKVSLKKQEQFIKKYQKIKDNLGAEDAIYFGDASHPTHNTKAAYGWILKGKEHDKYIKTNTGRKRINLNGVVNQKTKAAIVTEEATINADAIIRLFEAIAIEKPRGKIHVVMDNARSHHAKKVQEWLKKNKRFKILFLPPYSPNLNIIERLWRFYHQKVTASKYFESFEEFKRKSLEFFKNLSKYQVELETLLTDNFQTFTKSMLQS